MAEIEIKGDGGAGRQVSIPTNLPSNSHASKKYTNPKGENEPAARKAKKDPKDRPKVELVAKAKKKTFGMKIQETFLGEDARSVGEYIFYEVVIPSIKRLLVDSSQQGIERFFYGSSTPNRDAPRGKRTPYERMHISGAESRREMSPRGRRTHDFDEIILDSRNEAEAILDKLSFYIDDYGVVALSDLYEMVDITPSFTDEKWGWTSISGADVRQTRQGYVLLLPKPEAIE